MSFSLSICQAIMSLLLQEGGRGFGNNIEKTTFCKYKFDWKLFFAGCGSYNLILCVLDFHCVIFNFVRDKSHDCIVSPMGIKIM